MARRPNLSTLKEISPEYSLERLILKLKLQYFGHLMQRTNSLEKTLLLGKTEGTRASSRVETGMSGNFLSCSKGVKDPLEIPDVRCD